MKAMNAAPTSFLCIFVFGSADLHELGLHRIVQQILQIRRLMDVCHQPRVERGEDEPEQVLCAAMGRPSDVKKGSKVAFAKRLVSVRV